MQRELIDKINNTHQAETDICNYENGYFISNWPIGDEDSLIDMENKIKNDLNFHKQVVSIF